ncbi:Non-histone chromosomal protein 6 [Clathrus columnatus]|uniref:Non-histone chromosomal protein 6 n=1 Tax=Clathrus columnatus TaxID=1419009 RepID=A0AAV5A509_9AGAM|nr:Non-histone chromosomal protein 6 [Clathrus columnatus]
MPKMPKETTKATKKKAASEKKVTKKGKDGPKRALSAYMFFSQDWRERIKAENPDAGFGEVGKLLGAKWKELDESEKKPYIEQAAQDRARAEREKAAHDVGSSDIMKRVISNPGILLQGKKDAGSDKDDDDD